MKHYFSAKPDAPSERGRIETRIHGIDFCFITDSQVFSKRHIDFGTRLMIDTAIGEMTARGGGRGRFLDLGCGYGAIGITAKRVFPAMEVVLSDINERAVTLARENAALNHCKHVLVVESDGFSNIDGMFEVIMTNPPVRAGKQTVFSFYEGAYSHLNEGGSLYVVLQKKQGAPSSYNKLKEMFGDCEVLQKDGGYWVMRAIRKEARKDG
ncbi:MAG: class I SAM-dependent methyltransferase [Clostridiales bacterium]|nr:class I SAM-dependent methyltransferase [Clostridiales bacterium]